VSYIYKKKSNKDIDK